MPHLLVRHRVSDFTRWKSVYDDHESARDAAGLKFLHLWCNEDVSDEVFILFETTDVAKAKELTGSEDLKQSMQASGVQGVPDIVFLTEK